MVLLLFLSACDIAQQPATTQELATSCPPDCTGGSGSIETTINFPLDGGNVYTSDRFAPILKIENVGEANGDGMILFSGLDSDIFGTYGGCQYSLYFDTVVDDPEGYLQEVIFDDLPSTSVSTETSSTQFMTVSTRYAYTTYGVFEACLTGDPVGETACNPTGDKLEESSSGPLEITSIEEELTPVGGNAVTLRLNIDARVNAAKSEQLISVEDTSNTDCVLSSQDYIDAQVRVILFGQSYSCGNLRFENGKDEASVTCRIQNLDNNLFIGGQKLYTGWVEVNYGFEDRQSVSFNVIPE